MTPEAQRIAIAENGPTDSLTGSSPAIDTCPVNVKAHSSVSILAVFRQASCSQVQAFTAPVDGTSLNIVI